jgi:ATP phosphoribosyltransferase regulatory subunit
MGALGRRTAGSSCTRQRWYSPHQFERPKGGRQREFAQIGIEHYGGSGKTADIEILLIAVETFERLGIQGFQINLGSVDFFRGIVERMELPEAQMVQLKDALNVKDQSGLEAFLGSFPMEERRKNILRSIPHLTGDKSVIAEARRLVRNPRSVEALDHLEEIYSTFEGLGLAHHLAVDLGEIRGFDYYTGIYFRAYVQDLGFEVASGGRYDGLPAIFGEDFPAVGFSFSVDRLEQIVAPKLSVSEPETTSIDVSQGFANALQLRKSGKAVKLCL